MLWLDTSDDWVKQRNETDNGWIFLFRAGDTPGGGLVHRTAGWVTHSSATLTLPALPANHVLLGSGIYVSELFNSDGSDLLRMGNTDDDAYALDVDVASIGLKAPSAGAELGAYSSTTKTPICKYNAGGSAATTGKALCWLEYILVPAQP